MLRALGRGLGMRSLLRVLVIGALRTEMNLNVLAEDGRALVME